MIYSFHMPLFFLISGALVKKSSLTADLPGYSLKQARSLLIPFFFFGLISAAQWLALGAVSRTSSPPRDLSLSHLFEVLVRGSGREMRDVNGTLWFFTCLFVTSIYYQWLRKVVGPRMVVVIAGFLAFLTAIRHTSGSQPLPWNIDLACVGLLYYAVGHAAFVPRSEERSPLPGWQKLVVVCLLVATGLTSAVINTRVDMRGMIFGDFLLFCGSAFALRFALLLISSVLPSNWLLTACRSIASRSSLSIYPSSPC